MSAVPARREPAALTDLAEAVRTEHEAAQVAFRSAVDHAVRCGQLLAEAKAQVSHGGWGAWLAENFPASDRTARGYMRLAAHAEEVNRQGLADLGIEGALRELAAPRDEGESASRADLIGHVQAILSDATEEAAGLVSGSWEILTEDQRDELVREIVLPRYGATAADGTKLDPSWWASQLGGTAADLEQRIQRIRQSIHLAEARRLIDAGDAEMAKLRGLRGDPNDDSVILRGPHGAIFRDTGLDLPDDLTLDQWQGIGKWIAAVDPGRAA